MNIPAVQLVREKLGGHEADVSANAFQSGILSLRSRLNASCAISRLPNEILALIFELHRGCWNENTRNPLSWIFRICGVCSHFRAVALSSPQLWNCIYPNYPELTALMIKRSHATPLYVFYRRYKHVGHSEGEQVFSGLSLAMKEMHRVRCLDMHLLSIHESNIVLRSMAVSSARSLHSVFLDGFLVHGEDVLRRFLSEQAPKLCCLVLPWRSASPMVSMESSSLTSLVVEQPGLLDGPYTTELLPLLGRLPSLKTLHLTALNSQPFTSQDDYPMVLLPHLTRLNLDSVSLPDLSIFFEHLTLPACTTLRIQCSYGIAADITRLFYALQKAGLLPDSLPARESTSGDLLSSTQLLLSPSKIRLRYFDHDPASATEPRTYLLADERNNTTLQDDRSEGSGDLSCLFQTETCQALRWLTVDEMPLPLPLSICNSLRLLPCLENIVFDNATAADVPLLLREILGGSDSEEQARYPALTSVRVACTFPSSFSENRLTIQELCSLLRARKSSGHPPLMLSFKNHVCTPASRLALRRLREFVDVDPGTSTISRNMDSYNSTGLFPATTGEEDEADCREFHSRCIKLASDNSLHE